MTRRGALPFVIAALVAGGVLWYAFLRPTPPERWLGYAEADFVKIGPTQQGRLVTLMVDRGDEVAAGAPLFAQDDVDDRALRDQAAADLAQAREKLADLEGPGRDAEIIQARADVADTQAAEERIARDLGRSEALMGSGAATRQSVDQLRADTRSAKAKVESAQAKLALMTEPTGRAHAIVAQQAAVASATAALAAAEWRLGERRVASPVAGRIADTYARSGDRRARSVQKLRRGGSPLLSPNLGLNQNRTLLYRIITRISPERH